MRGGAAHEGRSGPLHPGSIFGPRGAVGTTARLLACTFGVGLGLALLEPPTEGLASKERLEAVGRLVEARSLTFVDVVGITEDFIVLAGRSELIRQEEGWYRMPLAQPEHSAFARIRFVEPETFLDQGTGIVLVESDLPYGLGCEAQPRVSSCRLSFYCHFKEKRLTACSLFVQNNVDHSKEAWNRIKEDGPLRIGGCLSWTGSGAHWQDYWFDAQQAEGDQVTWTTRMGAKLPIQQPQLTSDENDEIHRLARALVDSVANTLHRPKEQPTTKESR